MVFNRFLKATEKRRFLPSMYNILNKINKMLEDMGVRGSFPLILGYYHTKEKNILLASAGLRAEIKTENKNMF
ncbi:hypothetical protein I3679_006830 [Proteus mirabilis]|uniref:Uncharacterized protein n=1 Tax=Proteus mirabilis TaxID=584 RepID=A0ABD5LRN8_PROMI